MQSLVDHEDLLSLKQGEEIKSQAGKEFNLGFEEKNRSSSDSVPQKYLRH